MFEGEKITIIHPYTFKLFNCIVAGADRERGITLIDENEPEKIMFCSISTDDDWEEDWQEFIETMESSSRVWDLPKCLAKRVGMTESEYKGYIIIQTLKHGRTGVRQEALLEKCPFKN